MVFYQPEVESHLDRVFESGAKVQEKNMKGKVYRYKICGMGYTANDGESGSGRCIVESVNYDKSLDCNVLSFKDIDTGETRQICQFEVTVKEEA